MIVENSGRNDPRVVRKILQELEKEGKCGSKKLYHGVPNQKGRKFYFMIPLSEKMLGIMGKDEFTKILGMKYHQGIKKKIPLEIQYVHKLDLLKEEYYHLKKFFSRSKHYKKIADYTKFEETNLSNLEFFVYIIKKYYDVIDTPNYQKIYSKYFNAIFKLLIERMDLIHSNFTILKGNTVVAGHIKTIIANMMIEETKSGVMKKLGLSPKLGSKLARELFNEDGSPKIKVINEINIKSIGIKEFGILIPSGETLMKKWKEIQQDI